MNSQQIDFIVLDFDLITLDFSHSNILNYHIPIISNNQIYENKVVCDKKNQCDRSADVKQIIIICKFRK